MTTPVSTKRKYKTKDDLKVQISNTSSTYSAHKSYQTRSPYTKASTTLAAPKTTSKSMQITITSLSTKLPSKLPKSAFKPSMVNSQSTGNPSGSKSISAKLEPITMVRQVSFSMI